MWTVGVGTIVVVVDVVVEDVVVEDVVVGLVGTVLSYSSRKLRS